MPDLARGPEAGDARPRHPGPVRRCRRPGRRRPHVHAAATVDLPSLRLTAIQVCLGMAVSSGAKGSGGRAAPDEPTAPDLAALTDLGGHEVVVHVADPRGTLQDTRTT